MFSALLWNWKSGQSGSRNAGFRPWQCLLDSSFPDTGKRNIQVRLAGTTGPAIMDAILAGERDRQILAKLRDWRVKASEDTLGEVARRRLP